MRVFVTAFPGVHLFSSHHHVTLPVECYQRLLSYFPSPSVAYSLTCLPHDILVFNVGDNCTPPRRAKYEFSLLASFRRIPSSFFILLLLSSPPAFCLLLLPSLFLHVFAFVRLPMATRGVSPRSAGLPSRTPPWLSLGRTVRGHLFELDLFELDLFALDLFMADLFELDLFAYKPVSAFVL